MTISPFNTIGTKRDVDLQTLVSGRVQNPFHWNHQIQAPAITFYLRSHAKSWTEQMGIAYKTKLIQTDSQGKVSQEFVVYETRIVAIDSGD